MKSFSRFLNFLYKWQGRHAFSLVEMQSVSRCGRQTAMSRVPKHYDGDVGCEPCEFWDKDKGKTNNRRNTHRSNMKPVNQQ